MDLKRRTFLKTAALAAVGTTLPGCGREVDHLIPYLLPDDEIVPGVADWYASVCNECPAGCGILVRVMEGRVKKIEGNPDHPTNLGKLCARGQAAPQRLYNPDRLRGPLRRTGERGAGGFEAITWDEALALWIDQLRRHAGRIVLMTRSLTGTEGTLCSKFLGQIGGRLTTYEPGAELPLRAAMQASFGIDRLPLYDLAQADYLLSFGAPFLEEWVSPVAWGRAFGEFRAEGNKGRGRFVHIEPRLSVTAASADRWIPIRPGSEGFLAEGLAHVLVTEGWDRLSAADRGIYRRRYRSNRLASAANETEIRQEEIRRLAHEFSRANAPLAIAGGAALSHTNGTATALAVNRLNRLMGALQKPGGLCLFEAAPEALRDRIPRISAQALGNLVSEFERGEQTMLMLHHSNPLHELPPSIPVRRMFDRAECVVSFGSFLDDSTALADLILPDHTGLESWGDHAPVDMASGPVFGLRQPVVRPRWDTRATGDIFLAASKELPPGDESDLRWESVKDMVEAGWRSITTRRTGRGIGDEEWRRGWIARLQTGGWWPPGSGPVTLSRKDQELSVPQPIFDGDEREFPLHFWPFPSPALGRGTGANLPWLQQLPDPLTTAAWGTWVELNPRTAAQYGIRPGEVVRLHSPHGRLEATAVFVPGLRPDTVAMPMGQGHGEYGRYARGRGVNPLVLVGALFDEVSGSLATGATRIRIEPTGRQGTLVLLEQVEKSAGHDLISIDRQHKAHIEAPI
jgi:anaerobic selenocysteine-containing dehydrogenase